jgi:hypothetical protein
MLAVIILFIAFVRTVWNAARDPAMHGLLIAVALIVGAGTAFYAIVEDWRLVDSFYFSITTLTTVGYGDFAPKTDAGKLFTVGYLVIGLGAFATFVTTIVKRAPLWQRHAHHLEPRDQQLDRLTGQLD